MDDEYRPWSIPLRQSRPISVESSGGQVSVSVHAAQLVSGDDKFNNWDLIAEYDLQPKDGGLELTRDGDIEVLPTAFDPTSGRRLSSRQVAVRSNLNKVINELADQGDGFPESISMPELKPTGDLADVGTLRLQHVASADGWLTLAWDR